MENGNTKKKTWKAGFPRYSRKPQAHIKKTEHNELRRNVDKVKMLSRENEVLRHGIRSFKEVVSGETTRSPFVSNKEDEGIIIPVSEHEDDGDSEDEEGELKINDDSDNDSFVEESEFGGQDENLSSFENHNPQNNVDNLPEDNRNDDVIHNGMTSGMSLGCFNEGEEAVSNIENTINAFNNVDDSNKVNSVGSVANSRPVNLSHSNVVGSGGPFSLPDLNNPIEASESIKRNTAFNKSKGQKAMSVKFKDIIRASNRGKKKGKKSNRECSSDAVDGSFTSENSIHSTQFSSSSTNEIQKTIQVGCEIGYQVQDTEDVIRELVNGEGDLFLHRNAMTGKDGD
ncbi:hypothetical protein L2E82_33676 [Cichorium intybus]|uniref:Uncharacterized protein n=1 Tax=Cichorium intybus TaxID=13427 RepID=A0ACB9BL63_CICIN|nr:hypothetical protein L2E82_33676 [Cichorium intybus]